MRCVHGAAGGAGERGLTLEQAIAYIQDGRLVEVTPKAIRLRKRHLDGVSGKGRVTR